jgi:VWFA-related protein
MPMKKLPLLIAGLFAAVFLAAKANAQLLPPSPDAPPVSTAPAQPAEDIPTPTLKINANLVDLYFSVKNKSNELVPHLTRDDCSVTENKEPQTWKNFTAETDLPLTLGILLDTSGSQQRVLPLEQDAGSRFLEQILRKKDEAFVLSFDVNVDLLQDFTNSTRLLTHALQKAEINTAGGNGAAGIPGAGGGTVPVYGTPKGTLLYDAIYMTAHQKLNQESGRKAMIILTDGDDQGSDHKIGEAIEAAVRSNALIYVILIADVQSYGSFGYNGYSAAKRLSEESGGRLINVGHDGKKLEAAFQQIGDELRSQYVATYKPTNGKLDGTFRKIAITCKGDDMKVQVRKGYYAPRPEDE